MTEYIIKTGKGFVALGMKRLSSEYPDAHIFTRLAMAFDTAKQLAREDRGNLYHVFKHYGLATEERCSTLHFPEEGQPWSGPRTPDSHHAYTYVDIKKES